MEVLIKKQQADYRVVRTSLNWLVYCLREGYEAWIGAINSHSNRYYKAVRMPVTTSSPTEPLEQALFNSVDDGVQWIIALTENNLQDNYSLN